MNSLVIYYSIFGNTKAIAEAIAGELSSCGSVRLVDARQLSAADFDQANLVIMGTPTYRMNLPEEVGEILKNLPRRILKGKVAAAYDTSYAMSGLLAHFTASKRGIQKLRKLGGKQLIQPETFTIARAHEGPLLDGEIDHAKRWAGDIIALITH